MKAFATRVRVVAGCRLGLAILLAHSWFVPPLRAETPAKDEQLLKEQLDTARQEIERLKAENARLRGETAPSNPVPPAPAVPPPLNPPSAVSPSPGPAAPVPAPQPLASTVVVPAPIAEGTRVTASQLLADYRVSAIGGDARYKGRRILVEGTVRSFKKLFASMVWDVQLEAGDALGVLRCRMTFPGISDFRGEGSSILEGRRPFRAWKQLLSKGDTVVLEGRCEGLDGATIEFRECRPLNSGP